MCIRDRYGGCRAFLYTGYRLKIIEPPGELFPADFRQFFLALFQMLGIHKDFLPVLAYQVYVHFIDNSCQSGCN